MATNKKPTGRPKSEKYNVEKMVSILEEYTDNCLRKKIVPIFKEVCVNEHWNYHYVMTIKNDEGKESLNDSIKRLIDAKEFMLERKGLEGTISKSMAIFSLKQLGWKDQREVELGDEAAKVLKITLKPAE